MINGLIGSHVYATKGNLLELECEIHGQELEQQVLGYFATESEAVRRKRRPLILNSLLQQVQAQAPKVW